MSCIPTVEKENWIKSEVLTHINMA